MTAPDLSTAITEVLAERFWPKVNKNGPVSTFRPDLGRCWIWMAAKTERGRSGYGQCWNGAYMESAHRLSYKMAGGVIPQGFHVDHLCRVHPCVNPSHLEPVTNGENQRRGLQSYAIRTHCRTGLHDITQDGAVIMNGPRPTCVECRRTTNAKMQERVVARPKVSCPHCGFTLNAKSLKRHIQRNHRADQLEES